MERLLKGRTPQEEEIFCFLDEQRKLKVKPWDAIKLLAKEFNMEERIAAIWMQRHTSCFGNPDKHTNRM